MTALVARPVAALEGTAIIPGDKSCSHRALIFGALADGETNIDGLLESDDVLTTAEALSAFGVDVERRGPGQWSVTGAPWRSPDGPVDCGNSGTAARLLIGAASGLDLVATFTGDASLSQRPMARITRPLSRMGARFDGEERLPLTLHGGQLGGIDHRNQPASAQVKSAILLAGLRTKAPVTIREPLPSRDHSEIMLAEFGVDIAIGQEDGDRLVALGEGRTLTGCALSVAADPSSAAFAWLAAAIVPGATVTTPGVLVNPLRTGFIETLETMGADVRLNGERLQSGEIVADVHLAWGRLEPAHVAADRIPAMLDEIPALAVACAFAEGESVIEGLSELRHKESDRLGAIVAGLAACGVSAIVDGDALRIFGRGRVRGGGKVASHGDHRIAMAFAVLGLGAAQPVEVDYADMIATSFPGFADVMRHIGADIA